MNALINTIAHCLGYDIFITCATGARTDGMAFDVLPMFGGVSTCDGVEAWGFGLHLVASRLKGQPQSA
ncbi:hypothetical protein [Rhizobacter fulvus]